MKLHAILPFPAGSFSVHIGDHLRFAIICGPIWGSFAVWGSFLLGDHLRRCTGQVINGVGKMADFGQEQGKGFGKEATHPTKYFCEYSPEEIINHNSS